MNKFIPYSGFVEVEPISSEQLLFSDVKTFIEGAKVIGTCAVSGDYLGIGTGDIIFFRPHGFFETPEYEGKKHYVVRLDPEFILGVIKNALAKE